MSQQTNSETHRKHCEGEPPLLMVLTISNCVLPGPQSLHLAVFSSEHPRSRLAVSHVRLLRAPYTAVEHGYKLP